MTSAIWARHLAGKDGFGIGVVPIRDDETCGFGAIDIDVYPFDHNALVAKIEALSLPLIVCRTKSGGAHCYLFTSEPVPAKLARSKLREWAAALGCKPDVEIFPKQEHLDQPDDCGNWINVPYNGLDRSTRYAIGPDGKAMTPDAFLAAADDAKITAADLAARMVSPIAGDDDLWMGAPPCLRTLAVKGFGDWQNNGLFNIAVYLKKRYGDGWEERIDDYNRPPFMDPPVEAKAVKSTIKSVKKKPYLYMCKQSPIREVCDKDACAGCQFGVRPIDDQVQYEVIAGALHYMRQAPNGVAPQRLCNFDARIEEERKVDDGVAVARQFRIAGMRADGVPLPTITVPVKQLSGPWWLEYWGAGAMVSPERGAMHLIPAIQTVSAPVPERVVYAHLGWRKIDGRWLYLHGGGAIGADGPVEGFNVEPGGELVHYRLPVVTDLKVAIKTSLEFFETGPRRHRYHRRRLSRSTSGVLRDIDLTLSLRCFWRVQVGDRGCSARPLGLTLEWQSLPRQLERNGEQP